MGDIDKQIDSILKECVDMCADRVICLDTDEYIEISDKRWVGKGPNGYYRNKINALISTAVREARINEVYELEQRAWATFENIGVATITHEVLADRLDQLKKEK